MLEEVSHIDSPIGYFFSAVKHLLLRRLKRQRVVLFEEIVEIESFQDLRPSPEEHAAGRLAYKKMLDLVARLPLRCRTVVELRQIEGWSYRQIADHLGMTEKAVEKQLSVGLGEIRTAWKRAERQAAENFSYANERKRSFQ